MLTKEQILAADDVRTEEVHVPEWGGTVRVRTITATERDAFDRQRWESGQDEKMRKNVRASLIVMAVVDDDGKLMFSADDIEALGEKSATAMDRVFAAIQRINKMADEDIEAAAENLPEAPGDNDAGE